MEPLLTLEQVARILQIHPDTLRQRIRERRFPQGVLVSDRERRWTEDDIKLYLAWQRAIGEAPAEET